jgi:hypothetical protein
MNGLGAQHRQPDMGCERPLQGVRFRVTGLAPAEIQYRKDSWHREKGTEAQPNPEVGKVGGKLWAHDP